MNLKIILLLSIITFNVAANTDDLALEEFLSLSNQSGISFEEGKKALLQDIFPDFDHIENPEQREEELRKWQTQYNEARNKIFVLTHIARIRHQLSQTILDGRIFRPRWQRQERMTRIKIKRDQLQVFEQVLQMISSEDFDHDEHQFYSPSDLEKINSEGFAINTFSSGSSETLSKSLSKSLSKGGGGTDNSPTSFIIFDSVFEYMGFKPDYDNTSLSEQALGFLNRLGIEEPTPYFSGKDLSALYRTAPPSQAKSNACLGFALAADMEFELRRTHQIRQSENLSPYSVYASLRYREEGKPSPDCLELHSLSDTIAEGLWEMDRGSSTNFITNTNFCLTSSLRDSTNHTGYVSVKNMEMYTGVTFTLLKTMIDHNKPPALIVASDAKEEMEDWINITEDGRFNHIFVVVGYGMEDIDPFTLKKRPYFLIRDSLTSQPITYKISAKNLLYYSLGVLKITQLERH